MPELTLLQLPVPPPSAFASTGNVPLASGSLASALKTSRIDKKYNLGINLVSPDLTDTMGDQEIIDYIINRNTDILGLSLYLWNSERSLFIAEKVKEYSKDIKVVLGGPEINADNLQLIKNSNFDFAIEGEAEESFSLLIESILECNDKEKIPNLFYKDKRGNIYKNNYNKEADFQLNKYPSPYLNGIIPVDPERSTYIETVRGCRSECTYCFYPKSSNILRSIDIDETIKIIKNLKENGARELVFLDPTFNHRPHFERFLDALIDVNYDQQLRMFSEVRPEGITSNLIKKFKKANFNKIEIGMQSINQETLKKVKRFGSPTKVADVARKFADEGIDLLLDLIIGLPGDTKEDIIGGVEFFKKYNLEDYVQAFILSILPGTAMRKDAIKDGLNFLQYPPYRVISNNNFTKDELITTFLEAEELLDKRLDEVPRLLLTEIHKSIYDIEEIDLDQNNQKKRPEKKGARHFSFRFRGLDLYQKKDMIFNLISDKINKDPYCTLDIILIPMNSFPLNLVEELKYFLLKFPESYQSRVLSHRNENYQRRIGILFPENFLFSQSFFYELNSLVTVFQDMEMESVIKNIKYIGRELPSCRILNNKINITDWKKLKKIDPECITFLNREYERKWNMEILGYGE